MNRTGPVRCGLHRTDAVGAGVCVLLSLTWYLAVVRPLVAHRSATAGLCHDVQAGQQKASELKTATATVKERLRIVRQELAASPIQLDSATHINKRISRLTGLFSDCRLEVDDVKTGPICSGRRYDLVPITIVGRGGYARCIKLLHGLCGTFPDMSVMCIDLGGNPAQAAEGGRFQLDLFWYAAPGGPAQNAAREKSPGGAAL
jgi:hypothetical protein